MHANALQTCICILESFQGCYLHPRIIRAHFTANWHFEVIAIAVQSCHRARQSAPRCSFSTGTHRIAQADVSGCEIIAGLFQSHVQIADKFIVPRARFGKRGPKLALLVIADDLEIV